MSRSLQMLNVARLNVKAQKNQTESEQLETEGREADRTRKRRSSDRNKSGIVNIISKCPVKNLLFVDSNILKISSFNEALHFPKISIELLFYLYPNTSTVHRHNVSRLLIGTVCAARFRDANYRSCV